MAAKILGYDMRQEETNETGDRRVYRDVRVVWYSCEKHPPGAGLDPHVR